MLRVQKIAPLIQQSLTAVKKHPYPMIVSCWTAVIFTERFVVDQRVFGLKGTLAESATSTAAVFCFLTVWLLVLAAMLVDREAIARGKGRVLELGRRALEELFSPWSLFLLSFGLFFVLLAHGAKAGEQFAETLQKWVLAVWALARELVSPAVLFLVGSVTLICGIWVVIHYFLRSRIRRVEEAIHETLTAAYFMGAAVGFYLWLYYLVIFPRWDETLRFAIVGGLMKDTLVYASLALVLVVGTYKAGEALSELRKDLHRWLVFGVIGLGTIFLGVAALWFEFNFKDNVLLQGKAIEYPAEFQQKIIAGHIMVRDFGIMVPLLFVVFLRFLKEVEDVNLKQQGRTK